MSVLIANKAERDKRNYEKMALVVQFLKQETYSDINNLILLLGYKVRRPLDRLLNKLIALGYVSKHVFEFQTGKISIWGITDLGLTQNIRDINEDFRPFEPSKVKFITLEHKLMNQKVQIYLEQNGWTGWRNADQYSFRTQYDVEHRPDAIMVAPNGFTIAIETERTLKHVSRYRSIFKSHILAKQKGYWSAVFYIVPDDNVRRLLEKRFDKIDYIPFDVSKHPFESYRTKLVRIFTLEEVKVLETN
ncbi:Mobilization protein (plasmid) [Vibrio harveyi]|uniref:MobC family replication-relaxation protein n=1 Tax=Vibrio harveyi TaxID=669 RepID=UPI0002EFFA35|nr:MobC family replication-relaxation protein [Vibrio harveyi]ELY1990155.1 mobilization protein [Vibrio harveyi]MCG9237425.1 mobilization protein [Vibrio harveyi]MCG9589997.1 mobilization protein [Vibrio harveyi]MCG9612834.1 mobilization protein [Vibrio harveyi]MCG9671311.1 mobilization protein [Vibrio harveyi]